MRILPDHTSEHFMVQMEDAEKTIVAALLADVSQLLSADLPEPGETDAFERLVGHLDPDRTVERPTDPALLRLLPDVDSSDPERSVEFRRLTERDLRETKLHSSRIALHSLGQHPGPITLDTEAARAWMRAMTDVRLVLAARLGITDDDDAEHLLSGDADLDDTGEAVLSLYELTTWLQEHLTQFVLDALHSDADDPEDAHDTDDEDWPEDFDLGDSFGEDFGVQYGEVTEESKPDEDDR